MPFNRNEPADLVALQSEVNNDPISMGYAAVVDQTTLLLKLLNEPDSNVGGDTISQEMTPAMLLDNIEPGDLTVGGQFTQGELEYLKLVFEATAYAEDSLEQWRAKIIGLFPGNSQTVANINAASRPISRAEVLFGVGTVIVRDDWIAARDYQP